MVTLPSIFNLPTAVLRSVEKPPPKPEEELDHLVHQMIELLAPLARVDTLAQLRRQMNQQAAQYWHLRYAIARRLLAVFGEKALSEILNTYDSLVDLVRKDSQVLRPLSRERLSGALESYKALVVAFAEADELSQGQMWDALLECRDALEQADMSIATVMLVLLGEVAGWKKEAVHWLCLTADGSMLEVEDTFLMRTQELGRLLEHSGKAVSLSEVRRRLALPS